VVQVGAILVVGHGQKCFSTENGVSTVVGGGGMVIVCLLVSFQVSGMVDCSTNIQSVH
jgi:hypothetical protein